VGELEFGLLGPLTVTRAHTPLRLGGRQQRAVLALLLVEAGALVSTDRIVDVLWGERVPKGAIATLHTYVSHLRDLLEPGRPRGALVATEPTGYRLCVDPSHIDAAVFEQRARSGRIRFEAGRLADASAELSAALALWRGPVLEDLRDYEFAQVEATRLEELRLAALDTRVEADLLLGRHAGLVAELDELTAAYPTRERVHAQRMLALYRCGRQAEALAGYQRLREALADELGIDPGPAIRELHQRMLRHDPALELTTRRAASLPAAPNALLGRERETEELVALLRRDDLRLLVLTGAGGSGKTRLAVEAARDAATAFTYGAAFVSLAAVDEPDLMLAAIAQAVGGDPVLALGAGSLLIVLDNVEQIRAAGPTLVELLRRVPRLTLLVTSRVVLRVSGEHVYPVAPLPDDAAVRLFLERAREAEPRLRLDPSEMIQQICRRLDGLPLAIELAASRLRMLTPAELLARLDTRLPILTGGPRDLPQRQQTLRATIEWSVDLLDKDDQRDMYRLAVFRNGWTLAAAEAVCGVTLEQLGTFVDHSLVHRVVGPTGSRYHMLETIREHAAEQLATDDALDELRCRHAAAYLTLAKSLGLSADELGSGVQQRHDVALAEQDNMRAALDWALDHDPLLGLDLASALEQFWVSTSPREGGQRFDALLSRAGDVPLELRARTLRDLGASMLIAGEIDRAATAYRHSLELFEQLGHKNRIIQARHRLASAVIDLDDLAGARQLLTASLAQARAGRFRYEEAEILGTLGWVEFRDGDPEKALELQLASLQAIHDVGGWAWGEVNCLINAAQFSVLLGRLLDAERYGRQALELSTAIGNRINMAYGLAVLALAAQTGGDDQRAGRLWGAIEAEEARAFLGHWSQDRDEFATQILTCANTTFQQGREAGQQLTLNEAVAYALQANGA
jgi:predicted ATPase/DNA-binding SARP family transcriptional activator